ATRYRLESWPTVGPLSFSGGTEGVQPVPDSSAARRLLGLSPRARQQPRTVVLVVDDDIGIREALHLILDDEYLVLDAAHGRTAIGIVCAQRVDLVLLDILMP